MGEGKRKDEGQRGKKVDSNKGEKGAWKRDKRDKVSGMRRLDGKNGDRK